ncbi:hypothetical protein AK830_g2177 [Neonectria ditissima]|uniref:Uncharacterized protein n=1 Tax=Neonectria ditissima TaxID=78410 RepID=A0A0P7BVF0_9HYPO|nr:hypothetical protein AK830_g2177 [Neonectria ditissima]
MSSAHQESDAHTKLSLNNTTKDATKPAKKKSKKVVADSWDDEDSSDSEPGPEKADEEGDEDDDLTSTPKQTKAPPPTPLSPVGASWTPAQDAPSSRASPADPSRRPEKTDAVARRMIVAGLGLKAPKLTDEQRAYQRSVREQEKKRREQEKAAEQTAKDDAERAKAAVWDE